MATILGIEQSVDLTTSYCQAFRQRDVYSHPTLTGTPPTHFLISCFNSHATPSNVHKAMQNNNVRFITGSGHGEYDRFTGHGGTIIWDTTNLLPHHATDKIVHLLACQTGGILGLDFIDKGANAYWGYTVDFIFFHQDPAPDPLTNDRVAEIFLYMDSLIDRGILAGKNADEIYTSIENYFWSMYLQLTISGPAINGLYAAILRDNFVHLVCPAKTWGDPLAAL